MCTSVKSFKAFLVSKVEKERAAHASLQVTVEVPIYVYEAFREQNKLEALGTLLTIRSKFRSGMIWKENLSWRRLALIMNVNSPNTAKAHLQVWLKSKAVGYDESGNLNLFSLMNQKQASHNLLAIIIDETIEKTVVNIRKAYVRIMVEHQEWKALKNKDTKKVMKRAAASPVAIASGTAGSSKQKQGCTFDNEADTKLSCNKLAKYLGLKTAGGASKWKKKLKDVVAFERNRLQLGRMYPGEWEHFRKGRKNTYINRYGYVYQEEVASVSMVRLFVPNTGPSNSLNACLNSSFPSLNTPEVNVSKHVAFNIMHHLMALEN